MPSLADPSLAPAGAHVLSAYVQWVPADGNRRRQTAVGRREPDGVAVPGVRCPVSGRNDEPGPLSDNAEVLNATLSTLERYAPGLRALVVQSELITPADMERGWGLTGGHIFHGELSLDQAFTMRPLLGWGRYRTPISGLYSVRLGDASRHRAHRWVGRSTRRE